MLGNLKRNLEIYNLKISNILYNSLLCENTNIVEEIKMQATKREAKYLIFQE